MSNQYERVIKILGDIAAAVYRAAEEAWDISEDLYEE